MRYDICRDSPRIRAALLNRPMILKVWLARSEFRICTPYLDKLSLSYYRMQIRRSEHVLISRMKTLRVHTFLIAFHI